MGISQGSVLTNTQHINDLATKIRNTTNCETLGLIVDQYIHSIVDLVAAKAQEEINIISNYLPILDLPGANPFAIVKWIAKLVTGTAYPQLMAMIKMTMQLIQLANALENLASALADAVENIEYCAVNLPKHSLNTLKQDLKFAERQAKLSFKAKYDSMDFAKELKLLKTEIQSAKNAKNVIKYDIAALSQGATQTINRINNDIGNAKTLVNGKIDKNLNSINSVQTKITTYSGGAIPSSFDTSSKESFESSVNLNHDSYISAVNTYVNTPTVTLEINSTIIFAPDDFILSWTSTVADTITINGVNQSSLNGFITIPTTTYTKGDYVATVVASNTETGLTSSETIHYSVV